MTDPLCDRDNIACRITAPGRSAIATTWIRGPLVLETLAQFFHAKSGRPLSETPLQRVVYGSWRHERATEDVVVVRLDPITVEVHSHGGSQAPGLILAELNRCGFCVVDAQTALQTSLKNPWQAAVLRAVQQARTLRAANRALQNADGRLCKAIEELRNSLKDSRRDEESLRRLAALRESYKFGSRLVRGWQVAIAGRPNVGKSSLINRLAGFARSIVFDEPGTTRDVVREMTAIGGWPIELCDTAGLQETVDPVEKLGIQAASRVIEAADLVIWVSDLSQPWSEEDRRAADSLKNPFLIHNKSDLKAGSETTARPPGLCVSLLCDPNIESIISALESRLFSQLPPEEQPFLTEPWQMAAVDRAFSQLKRGDRASAQQTLEVPSPDSH